MSRVNRTDEDGYVVRWFEERDLSGFLSLDRVVFGRRRSERWFRWKYVDNPYVDHVPVFVVEKDGEIVGARPFLAFRMRAGSETVLALQPADTMVHPEHRRKGLFTRMTKHAIDHYAGGDPKFFFNFPNQRSRPGYLKLGWQIVGDRKTYYRIQNPSVFFRTVRRERDIRSQLLDFASPIVRRLHDLNRSWTRAQASTSQNSSGTQTTYSITHYSGVETPVLTELYRATPPDAVHALRDETYYQWRFSSPAWKRETYVAEDDRGDSVAAIVVRTRTTSGGVTVTQLADVVPLVQSESRRRATARLLERIVREYAESDLLSVPKGDLSDDLLREFGFVSDAVPPLSWVSDFDCRLVALPLNCEHWSVGGKRLSQRSNWHVSFGERDTA